MSPPAHSASSPSFEALYETHFDYVWRTMLRLGVMESAVADATQNAFLVVHRRLHTFDATRPVRPWLFGIARNVAREERRRFANRKEAAPIEVGEENRTQARLEAAQLVRTALSSLEEVRREVFVLHALDEVPMKEVAATLQMPLNTAYSHFRRGREAFRLAVRRLGGQP